MGEGSRLLERVGVGTSKSQLGEHFRRCLNSSQIENNYFTEMCSGSEEGSYLRLIDFYITQL